LSDLSDLAEDVEGMLLLMGGMWNGQFAGKRNIILWNSVSNEFCENVGN
jgi:hypothetical protein